MTAKLDFLHFIKSGKTFTTADALKLGISSRMLSYYVKTKKLERLRPGVYVAYDAFDDPFVTLQSRQPKGIFSSVTALGLYDLSDEQFYDYHLTFPRGYHLRSKQGYRVIPHYVSEKMYAADQQKVKTVQGNEVIAYSPERSLVDIWRFHVGDQLEIQSLSLYLHSAWRDLPKLNSTLLRIGRVPRLTAALEVMINA